MIFFDARINASGAPKNHNCKCLVLLLVLTYSVGVLGITSPTESLQNIYITNDAHASVEPVLLQRKFYQIPTSRTAFQNAGESSAIYANHLRSAQQKLRTSSAEAANADFSKAIGQSYQPQQIADLPEQTRGFTPTAALRVAGRQYEVESEPGYAYDTTSTDNSDTVDNHSVMLLKPQQLSSAVNSYDGQNVFNNIDDMSYASINDDNKNDNNEEHGPSSYYDVDEDAPRDFYQTSSGGNAKKQQPKPAYTDSYEEPHHTDMYGAEAEGKNTNEIAAFLDKFKKPSFQMHNQDNEIQHWQREKQQHMENQLAAVRAQQAREFVNYLKQQQQQKQRQHQQQQRQQLYNQYKQERQELENYYAKRLSDTKQSNEAVGREKRHYGPPNVQLLVNPSTATPPIYTSVNHNPLSAQALAGIPLAKHTAITKHITVPQVQKVHVPFRQNVQIQIPQTMVKTSTYPHPIQVPITKTVTVPQMRDLKVPIEKVKPYPVERPVPFLVEKRVPFSVEKQVVRPYYYPLPIKVPVVRTVVHKQPYKLQNYSSLYKNNEHSSLHF